MQQRRLRPGDVLDDYCPRERRVTDHAIVAMIDDNIKQTRCVVCDAEHEYKQAKVPPQRKKNTPALYTQVLDGLQGPARPPHIPDVPDDDLADTLSPRDLEVAELEQVAALPAPVTALAVEQPSDNVVVAVVAAPVAAASTVEETTDRMDDRVEGPLFRRQLIRAALPRPEGTPPPTRAIPEFTIRQPLNGRGGRPAAGGRRRGQHQPQTQNGPMRFGRSAAGPRSNGQRGPGGHGQGPGAGGHGQGGPNGNRNGGPRRGGKKR
jgi:hypothetical protein